MVLLAPGPIPRHDQQCPLKADQGAFTVTALEITLGAEHIQGQRYYQRLTVLIFAKVVSEGFDGNCGRLTVLRLGE